MTEGLGRYRPLKELFVCALVFVSVFGDRRWPVLLSQRAVPLFTAGN